MMEKMQNMMMKRYQMFAWLGLIIVLVAFLVALSGASANSTFFSADKATREAAGAPNHYVKFTFFVAHCIAPRHGWPKAHRLIAIARLHNESWLYSDP